MDANPQTSHDPKAPRGSQLFDGKGQPASTAWFLSLLGVIPFWTLALSLMLVPEFADKWLGGKITLIAYGAIILSFMGGVRWGASLFANPDLRADRLILSVMPPLCGWLAMLLPQPLALMLLAAAFAVQGWWDHVAARAGELPGWFGFLRLVITGLVLAALLLSLLA